MDTTKESMDKPTQVLDAPPSVNPTNGTPGFLQLARELRDMVYKHAFITTNDGEINLTNPPALLCVNKQVHAESKKALLELAADTPIYVKIVNKEAPPSYALPFLNLSKDLDIRTDYGYNFDFLVARTDLRNLTLSMARPSGKDNQSFVTACETLKKVRVSGTANLWFVMKADGPELDSEMKVCAVTGRVVPPDLDLATGQFAMVRDYLEDYMMGKERYVDMFAKLIAICSHFGLGYVAMA